MPLNVAPRLIWLSFVPVFLCGVLPARTQPITPAADGTGTVVQQNSKQFNISGGSFSSGGTNHFHSFEQFGLDAGQIANFLSNPETQNILGRITGGDASVINGLIQVTGSNANLYLLNPAGMLFGPDAHLDLGGSFTATTADGVGFEAGIFQVVGSNDYSELIGTPNTFAFTLSQPGSIVNSGELAVGSGESITMLGGTVVNTGTIEAPGGNITIAAVPGESLVRISNEGLVMNLEVESASPNPGDQNNFSSNPLSLPELLAGSGNIGNATGLTVNPDGTVSITGSGLAMPIEAGDVGIAGLVQAQSVNLISANRVSPSNPSLIRTHDGAHNAPTVSLLPQSETDPKAFVFLDATVPDFHTLLYGGKPGTTTVVVTPEEDGIAKVTNTLSNVSGVDELHVVSEGDAGNFWLGNQFISTENAGLYAADFQAWGEALSANADLLIYACLVALGLEGDQLLASIAEYTGADVAGSTNLTGNAALGGDWILENRIGEIEATTPFSAAAVESWMETLQIFTVQNVNDAGVGSLRQAIATANGNGMGDEIRFNPGIFDGSQGAIVLTTGELLIDSDQDLVIDGAIGGASGVTIDGNAASRVFNIAGSGDVSLENLTIQNGNVVGNGGGIFIDSDGMINITNSTISGNSATSPTSKGAGIFIYDNDEVINIANSNISENFAGYSGGGVFIDENNGTITISENIIDSNNAALFGGGILDSGNNGTVNIINSRISGNSGNNNGGGIINTQNSGVVNIVESVISGNSTTNSGGGIFNYNILPGGIVNVSESIISGNIAAGPPINSQGGGGLLNVSNFGEVNVFSSTISENISDDIGGGISNNVNTGVFNIENSTISGNTSAVSGAGIVNINSTISLNNATIHNNTAGNNGGGIANFSSTVSIGNSIVAGNVATALTATGDVNGIFDDQGNNLIGITDGSNGFLMSTLLGSPTTPLDPRLGPLANNGGPTPTHALLANSPALNAAGVGATNSDQRGFSAFGTRDIGAYEAGPFDPLCPPFCGPEGSDRLPEGNLPDDSLDEEESPFDFGPVLLQKIESETGVTPAILYVRCAPAGGGASIKQAFEQQEQSARQSVAGYLGRSVGGIAIDPNPDTDLVELLLIVPSETPVRRRVPGVTCGQMLQVATKFRHEATDIRKITTTSYLPHAQQLYDWMIRPIKTDLDNAGVENIAFIMDKGLRSLPIAALHDGERFLVESYSLGLMPSLNLVDTRYVGVQNTEVLAMGASEFDNQIPLLAVPVEVGAIANTLWSGKALLNDDFTLKNLRAERQAKSYGIIHLATHAEFQPGNLNRSYIQLADGRLRLDQLRLLGLNNPPAELMVLSACATALGDPQAELGFAGLALQAGVKSALASLWNVDDAATAGLMVEFYQQLQTAPIKAEAVRQAQIALIQGEVALEQQQLDWSEGTLMLPPELAWNDRVEFSHPYFWSAFTLVGSPW